MTNPALLRIFETVVLAAISGPLSGSTVNYAYDELGRIASESIGNAGDSKTYGYDALGRVTSVSNPLGQFGYQYLGQTQLLQSCSFPNGQTTNYAYYPNASSDGSGNGDRRLQSIQNQSASGSNISTFGYTYDPAGEILTWTKQWDLGALLPSGFSYDSASQLVMAVCPNPSTLAGQSFFYSYDATGNRTQEQVDSTINTSNYNTTNEYVAENGGGNMTFAGAVSEPATVTVGGNSATVDSFNDWMGEASVIPGANVIPVSATDSFGNSINKSINVTVSGGPNRALNYDSNGNLLNNGAGQTYQWDAENRLVGIVQASGTTGFKYDGAGHRVQETLNGTVIKQWVWCGSQPCEEWDGSGGVTKRFYAQGEQIGGVPYYFTRDHLGSVREMTDGTGAIRARYDYDPFGRVTKMSGDLSADFGFTGDYYHAATGLSLTLYRAYDPNLGRWLSRDPIGEAGGLNLYGYVGNNPINGLDPLGLCDCNQLQNQLNSAQGILNKNLAYFAPGGQYSGAGSIVSGQDAAAETAAVGALGAAGRAAFLDSARNVGRAGPLGTTIYTTSTVAGRVGLGLGIAGAANDVYNLANSDSAGDYISNGAAVALDGIGFIPGAGQVAGAGQFVVSTTLLGYSAYENAQYNAATAQNAANSQQLIQAAQLQIGNLEGQISAGCN